MSKVCELCGKRPVAGRKYARRGLAKYKGGVGRKITGITKRTFTPNIQKIRVRTEKGGVIRVRLCTKCLKTALRDGTLLKATRKPRPPRQTPPPAAEQVRQTESQVSQGAEASPSGQVSGASESQRSEGEAGPPREDE